MSIYAPGSISFGDQMSALAKRARELRILRNLTQAELAHRSRLGLATITRFERSGNTSVENLIRIAYALAAEDGFAGLFELPKYRSLDEALAEEKTKTRQRVRKSS